MTLFDMPVTPAPVRSSDPETSRAAVAAINHKERKREVTAAMVRLGRPAPASEIQAEMRREGVLRDIGAIRSRLSQLEHDRVTRKTGGVRCTPVEDGGTGRAEALWELAR